MSAPKGLSGSALAQVCGVTERTVRNWLVGSPPVPCTKRGKRNVFDPAAVASWLLTQEKREALARLQGYIASVDPGAPKPPSVDAKAKKFAKKLDKKRPPPPPPPLRLRLPRQRPRRQRRRKRANRHHPIPEAEGAS